MTAEEIARAAWAAFQINVAAPPPLTLRGTDAVDSYDEALRTTP